VRGNNTGGEEIERGPSLNRFSENRRESDKTAKGYAESDMRKYLGELDDARGKEGEPGGKSSVKKAFTAGPNNALEKKSGGKVRFRHKMNKTKTKIAKKREGKGLLPTERKYHAIRLEGDPNIDPPGGRKYSNGEGTPQNQREEIANKGGKEVHRSDREAPTSPR